MHRLAVPTSFLVLKYEECWFATDSDALQRLVLALDDRPLPDTVDFGALFPEVPLRGKDEWYLIVELGQRQIRLRSCANIEVHEFSPERVFALPKQMRGDSNPWVRGVVQVSGSAESAPEFALWIDLVEVARALAPTTDSLAAAS